MQTAGLIVVCLGGEQQQKSVRSDVGKLIPPGRATKKTRSVQQGCRFVPKKHFPKLSATDGTKPNLNIGETRVGRLDEKGQIYNPEGRGVFFLCSWRSGVHELGVVRFLISTCIFCVFKLVNWVTEFIAS